MGKADGASKLSAKDLYGELCLQTFPKFPMAKAPLESWMQMLGSFRLELNQSHMNPGSICNRLARPGSKNTPQICAHTSNLC